MKEMFTGWNYGHQFDQKSRAANKAKSDMEDLLAQNIQSGFVKVGSKLWKLHCELIEELNSIASSERENFEERNS